MFKHTEHFPNGSHTVCFNTEGLRQAFIGAMEDIKRLGVEGALDLWARDEAAERSKLGLKNRKS